MLDYLFTGDPLAPTLLILLPSRELVLQAKSYLKFRHKDSECPPPEIGSCLVRLYFEYFADAYAALIVYVGSEISISDVQHRFKSFSEIEIESIKGLLEATEIAALFTLCSHLTIVNQFLRIFRELTALQANRPFILEMQHGWVAGKVSHLREGFSLRNPDFYLCNDVESFKYLSKNESGVEAILTGDILLALQIRHALKGQSNYIDVAASELSRLSILLCCTPRDFELGILSGQVYFYRNAPLPREAIEILESVNRIGLDFSLKLRSKPHNQKEFPGAMAPYTNLYNAGDSLVSQLVEADLVLSAASAVTISAANLGIPSCFYATKCSNEMATMMTYYAHRIPAFHSGPSHSDFMQNIMLLSRFSMDHKAITRSQRKQRLTAYSSYVLENGTKEILRLLENPSRGARLPR